MSSGTGIAEVEALLAPAVALGQVAELLDWDRETHMPSGATAQRAEHCAALAEVLHEKWTDPRLGDCIDRIDRSGLDARQHAVLRVAEFERGRKLKVPTDLAVEIARTIPESFRSWTAAKEAGRFADFRNVLARVVDLKRREAEALADGGDPYDALLAEFEPGTGAAEIERRFKGLRRGLVRLLSRIRDTGREQPVVEAFFPEDVQLALARELASSFGYDWSRGRIDTSVHPFSSGSGSDVRITTRVDESDPFGCIYATIHETGHALYEQGVDPSLAQGILGTGASMGVHESQSRILENQIGRSRAFCEYLFGRMRNRFDDFGLDGPDTLYRAVNNVAKGCIRTESDEVQYNLHVMLRFDLERALISGDLGVGDLEAAWNDRFREDFGFEVDNAANGVLQDAHWAAGLFGYFPTYSLGNVYAGELHACLRRDVPELDGQLARGDTDALREWLRNRVHRHGRSMMPAQLMSEAIGRLPDEAALLDYLERKFGALYDC